MQTQSPPLIVPKPASPARRGADWTAGIRAWLYPEEGWSSVFLLLLVIGATLWTVEGAGWVKEMPSLEPIALLAVALGFLLAKIRLPAALLHPVAAVVGVIVVIGSAAGVCTGDDTAQRLVNLTVRMYGWWEIAILGGISNDPIPFLFQVVALDWIIAYLSAWFVFRSQHVWLGIVPSGVVLLINLTYLPGRFTAYFVLYMMAAMLLVSRLHLVHQQRHWRKDGIEAPASPGASYLGHAFVVAILAMTLAWQVPVANAADPVADLWERVSGPWREFEREFDRLFSSVGSGRAVPLHAFGKTLPFRGAVGFGLNLGPQGAGSGRDVVMSVQTDQPNYWRAAAYDNYTGQGWMSSARNVAPTPREVRRQGEDNLGRRDLTVTVEVQYPTDVVFSAGILQSVDIAAVGEVAAPASYTVQLIEQSRNRGLPSDLRQAASDLRDRLRNADRLYTRGEIQQLLPPDVVVDSITPRRAEVDSVKVTRLDPVPADAAVVRPQDRLGRAARYQVTGTVSEAKEEDLRKAGTDVPGWVQDRYLLLPRDLPDRIRNLAKVWTEAHNNTYDKAAAIERRLRSEYTYSLDISPPPQGVDGVDHFLFTLRKGYSDYYASAMSVMLRSLGIPARVAVGYVAGDYDTEKKAFVVREAHAHAWPEVYFPRYGWIEFNPTPAWPELPRTQLGSDFAGGSEEDLDGIVGDPDFESLSGSEEQSEGASAGIDWAALLTPYLYLLATLSALFLAGRVGWLWGLSGLDVAAQAYEKVCRLSALGGMPLRPQDTPSEYAQRVGAAVPTVRDAVSEIAQSYTRHVFGQRPISEVEDQRIEAAWKTVRQALVLKALRWRGRRR